MNAATSGIYFVPDADRAIIVFHALLSHLATDVRVQQAFVDWSNRLLARVAPFITPDTPKPVAEATFDAAIFRDIDDDLDPTHEWRFRVQWDISF